MTDNVRTIFGEPLLVHEPNAELIKALQQLLSMAESGQLQSYIGTGFTREGLRVSTWCDFHDDLYQMLGSMEWLKAEYVTRHIEDFRK